MPTTRRLRRLVRSVFSRHELEEEVDAEMRLHVELETEEMIRQGMPAAQAHRHAQIAFGGVQRQKEEALEQASVWMLDGIRRDVRIAIRTLLRHPSFAVTATLALALAIAVNTTMYGVLDAMIHPRDSQGACTRRSPL